MVVRDKPVEISIILSINGNYVNRPARHHQKLCFFEFLGMLKCSNTPFPTHGRKSEINKRERIYSSKMSDNRFCGVKDDRRRHSWRIIGCKTSIDELWRSHRETMTEGDIMKLLDIDYVSPNSRTMHTMFDRILSMNGNKRKKRAGGGKKKSRKSRKLRKSRKSSRKKR